MKVIYRFGPFEFDTSSGELVRAGRRLPLRPQVGRLLTILLERAGQMVSHETLRGHLWDEGTHVEWERGLYTCVRELRGALQDDAEAPRYVETLPGRGYRFLAPLTKVAEVGGSDPPPPRVAHPVRGWLLLLVLLSAAVIATVSWHSRTRSHPSAEVATGSEGTRRVLIGRFENRTGEAMLDGSLEGAFRIGLERSLRTRSLSAGEIGEALQRMVLDERTPIDRAVGSELSLRAGAELLILGGISKVGSVYQLEGQVVDPESERTLHAVTRQASKDEILSTLESVCGGVLEFLQAGDPAPGAQTLQHVTTSSLEALRSYSLAIEREMAGDPEAAVALLERAVSLDPEFVMARLRLARTYHNSGAYDAARDQLRAVRSSRVELTEFEQLYLAGWLATVEGRGDAAVRAWTQMTRLFPENATGWNNRGSALQIWRYDFDSSLESFEEAIPRAATPLGRRIASIGYAGAQLASGHLEEARQAFEASTSYRDIYAFSPIPAMALELAGDYDAAHRSLALWAGAESDPLRYDDGTHFRALFYAYEERWSEAADLASQLTSQVPNGPVTVAGLARRVEALVFHAAANEGKVPTGELEDLVRQGEALSELEGLDATACRVPVLALLGTLAARSGRLDLSLRLGGLARELVSRTEPDAHFAAWLDLLHTEILSRQRGPELATRLLESRIARTSFYPYHARATLAELYEATARPERAAAEYDWLVRNRGRALVECSCAVTRCRPDTAFNGVALGRAHRWMRDRADTAP